GMTRVLETLPPVGKYGGFTFELAAVAAQAQEVVTGAEARVLEQPERPLSGALLEARLERPDFLDRRLEPAGNRQPRSLLLEHAVHGVEERGPRPFAGALGGVPARQHFVPEQRRKQKRRGDGLVLAHAGVGVGERQLDEALSERLLQNHVQ